MTIVVQYDHHKRSVLNFFYIYKRQKHSEISSSYSVFRGIKRFVLKIVKYYFVFIVLMIYVYNIYKYKYIFFKQCQYQQCTYENILVKYIIKKYSALLFFLICG